jgi:hypothetical protein
VIAMMTKEEADVRVRAAEQNVLAVAKMFANHKSTIWQEDFRKAIADLHKAEEVRAKLDKPRLKTADDIAHEYLANFYTPVTSAIRRRDEEILTQVEKLPQVREVILSSDGQAITYGEFCVRLSDLRNLINEETKQSGYENSQD